MEYSKEATVMPKYPDLRDIKTKNGARKKYPRMIFAVLSLCLMLIIIDIVLIYSFANLLQNVL